MRPIVFIPTVKNKHTLETIICGCYFSKKKAENAIISKLVELNYISFSTYHSSNPNINHIDQFIQYLYHQMDETNIKIIYERYGNNTREWNYQLNKRTII